MKSIIALAFLVMSFQVLAAAPDKTIVEKGLPFAEQPRAEFEEMFKLKLEDFVCPVTQMKFSFLWLLLQYRRNFLN